MGEQRSNFEVDLGNLMAFDPHHYFSTPPSRGTTPIDEISNDIADPLKLKSCPDWLVLEGRVNQSVAFSVIAKMLVIACLLRDGLVDFEGLTDALREGHSVVVDTTDGFVGIAAPSLARILPTDLALFGGEMLCQGKKIVITFSTSSTRLS